jgi:hypothetical protein
VMTLNYIPMSKWGYNDFDLKVFPIKESQKNYLNLQFINNVTNSVHLALLAIMLSLLLRLTDSDNLFGIFKLF